MTVLLVVLLVLGVGVAAAVAAGRVGGGLPAPRATVAPPSEHELSRPGDLDRVRFSLAFRGYRMDQVDEVLDAARDALTERDRQIEQLQAELARPADRARPAVQPGAAEDRPGTP